MKQHEIPKVKKDDLVKYVFFGTHTTKIGKQDDNTLFNQYPRPSLFANVIEIKRDNGNGYETIWKKE